MPQYARSSRCCCSAAPVTHYELDVTNGHPLQHLPGATLVAQMPGYINEARARHAIDVAKVGATWAYTTMLIGMTLVVYQIRGFISKTRYDPDERHDAPNKCVERVQNINSHWHKRIIAYKARSDLYRVYRRKVTDARLVQFSFPANANGHNLLLPNPYLLGQSKVVYSGCSPLAHIPEATIVYTMEEKQWQRRGRRLGQYLSYICSQSLCNVVMAGAKTAHYAKSLYIRVVYRDHEDRPVKEGPTQSALIVMKKAEQKTRARLKDKEASRSYQQYKKVKRRVKGATLNLSQVE